MFNQIDCHHGGTPGFLFHGQGIVCVCACAPVRALQHSSIYTTETPVKTILRERAIVNQAPSLLPGDFLNQLQVKSASKSPSASEMPAADPGLQALAPGGPCAMGVGHPVYVQA